MTETLIAKPMPTGFGRLWTAQTVSPLGDGVTHAALPLLALTLTRDPMALPVVTAAGTLPWLLFGVLGGALVDRWDRMLAMCAAPFGAFLGGWLATTYDIRTPLYAAAGLLLAMTAVTATMTSNRRVETALRDAATTAGPGHPEPEDPHAEQCTRIRATPRMRR